MHKDNSTENVYHVDALLWYQQGRIDYDTSALEQQIDFRVYHLYGLTDEEIAIVEGKE